MTLLPQEKKESTGANIKILSINLGIQSPKTYSLLGVCGFFGSGKSIVASWLTKQIGAIHIHSDVLRKQMSGIALDQRGDDLLYSQENTERTY
jgi:uridine kinase